MNLQAISTLELLVSTFDYLISSVLVSVMDLLLHINRVGPAGEGELTGTTCVMVTHNPELECYADRILYVQDGVFVK
jgi:predicted ABC-type transport system involved in lysophospholipase L1 biosynthesis ATPase subunit